MVKYRLLQVFNLIAFVAVVLVNYLITMVAPMGVGEVSDMYMNLFTPASYTFLIWGLIYLLLLVFIYKQSIGLFKNLPPPEIVSKVGIWFILSCILNIMWIFAWTFGYIFISLLIMLLLLFVLIMLYKKVMGYKEGVDYWTCKLPFSVYLGWISVATIANITVFLTMIGFAGFWILGPVVFFIVVLLVALFLGWYYAAKYMDSVYGLVLVWSFIGIAIGQLGSSVIIWVSALIAAVLQLAIILYYKYKS